MEKLFSGVQNLIELESKSDTQISDKGGTNWHLEHLLLVIIGISKATKNSNLAGYKSKFNFPKLIFFTSNKIPRGKGTLFLKKE